MLSALITCDRQQQFVRSLTGLLQHLPDTCRQVLVCDDTRDVATVQSKDADARRIGASYPQKVQFFGREQRRLLAQQLNETSGVGQDTVEFALFGDVSLPMNNSGANRTALLLKSAGSKLLSFDDDCIFAWRRLQQNGSERLLHGVLADRQAYEGISETYTGDPIREMADMLGDQSSQDNTGTVRAVMAGLYGGRWFFRPFGQFFIQGALRDICYVDKASYRAAARYPFSFLQTPDNTISREPLFVAAAMGMDAEEILPPFIPNVRSQDAVWAMMLRCSCADSRIGHVPFSIGHEFSGRVPFEARDYRSVLPDVGLNMMLITADQLRTRQFANASHGLSAAGMLLQRVAAAGDAEFSQYLHELWYQHVAVTVSQLQRLLVQYDYEPSFWAKDCRIFIRDLQKSLHMHNRHYIEFPYRRLLQQTADMLIAWPAIWQAAAELNGADCIGTHRQY